MVKKLPVMQETRVPSLGKDTLKERMTTHSSILALRIPWTEEPVCVCIYIYTYIYPIYMFAFLIYQLCEPGVTSSIQKVSYMEPSLDSFTEMVVNTALWTSTHLLYSCTLWLMLSQLCSNAELTKIKTESKTHTHIQSQLSLAISFMN